MKTKILSALFILSLPLFASASEYSSRFIENMPELKQSSTDENLLEWTSPSVDLNSYTGLAVAQPYVFLADKNKYDGMSPDQSKFIADRLGAIFIQKMRDVMDVKAKPAEGVIVMNMALTELKMKKKRGLLSFTPVGAVAHAAGSDKEYDDMAKFIEKILLDEANVEIELLDGATGDVLAIRVLKVEGKEKGREGESWKGLKEELMTLANRFHKNYVASLANR